MDFVVSVVVIGAATFLVPLLGNIVGLTAAPALDVSSILLALAIGAGATLLLMVVP